MAGDVICQRIAGEEEMDTSRVARMGATGLCVSGPLSFTLHHVFERLAPGASAIAICKKLFLTLTVTAPIQVTSTLGAVTLLSPGKSTADAEAKVKQELVPTIISSIPYWGVFHTFNYRHTPVHRRPVMSSLAGVFWNIYISWQANKDSSEAGQRSTVTRGYEASCEADTDSSMRNMSDSSSSIASARGGKEGAEECQAGMRAGKADGSIWERSITGPCSESSIPS